MSDGRHVDALMPRPAQQSPIEILEGRRVVEVPQMGELVAEGIDETRILERLSGLHMSQPDLDRAVRITDPVAALDVGALGLEGLIPQTEAFANPVRIPP